jgi:hypothetical protein
LAEQDDVESDGCLAVKLKNAKLTSAEAARVSGVVEAQDRLMANGCDPTTGLDWLAATDSNRPKAKGRSPIAGPVNADIGGLDRSFRDRHIG